MGEKTGEGASRGGGWPAPLWVPGLLVALQGSAVAKQMVWSFLWPSLAWGAGSARPPRRSAAAGLQLGTVRAALRVRGLPRLQHHGPVPEEDKETWQRGEEVWVSPAEVQTAGEREPPSLPELLSHTNTL